MALTGISLGLFLWFKRFFFLETMFENAQLLQKNKAFY